MHEVRLTPVQASYVKGLQSHLLSKCSRRDTPSFGLVPLSTRFANGRMLGHEWQISAACDHILDPETGTETCSAVHYRLIGVTNNAGYGFSITYKSNARGPNGIPASADWWKRASIRFSNLATGQATGSITYDYPSVTVTDVTTISGGLWCSTTTPGKVRGIRRPGAASDTISVTNGANGVTALTRDGVTTNYNRVVSGTSATITVTNARQPDRDDGRHL